MEASYKNKETFRRGQEGFSLLFRGLSWSRDQPENVVTQYRGDQSLPGEKNPRAWQVSNEKLLLLLRGALLLGRRLLSSGFLLCH